MDRKDLEEVVSTVLIELRAIRSSSERMEERMDRMEERSDRMEQRSDRMEQRADRMEGRMDKMQGSINQIASRFEQLEDTMVDMLATQHKIERNVSKIAAGLGEVRLSTMRLDEGDAKQVQMITEHETRIQKLEKAVYQKGA